MSDMNAPAPDYRALMSKALLEIKELKTRLKRHEDERAEPIAVIGMACRFPGGADSPERFWELLRDGVDAIGEVPAGRWDIDRLHDADRSVPGKMVSRYGGFIADVGGFDAGFFGISPREAESLDPHQRILLEVCWEALEHANLLPESLFGSNAGVFIGVSSLDQALNQMGELPLTEIGPYHGTGCALAPIAGRISYNFGFKGPSFVVDTACSSSLLSLHLAAESLRRRECDLALGGGVHLLLHPGYSVAFSKAGMLAADGRCKTFDASADGYVRGEGCGVLVLKRLSDAQRDRDPILALLRGSAVNQDGASGGLTVPSGPSQEQVVRQALARAGITAAEVGYIEAHGTGTPLGDPIEVGALANVFKQPLRVASVKANIGHLEASAGIAGAIKVILALEHGAIPPHLHLDQPNPLIPWAELSITVPTRLTPWPAGGAARIAGISAFGFSGTNVHLLVSEPTAAAATAAADEVADAAPAAGHRLLVLSARSEEALRALARRWADGPLASGAAADFPALCRTAAVSRTAFAQRLAVVAEDARGARDALSEFATQGSAAGAIRGAAADGRPKTAFLFAGQGAQYPGMGRELYRNEPVFRAAIDECDRLLRPELGFSLIALLYPAPDADDQENATLLDATVNTQPALFALEYALSRLWLSWGVMPDAVLGHSVGELVAACVAGVFSLADGLRLIAARARLMQALPAGGAMAAVFADRQRVEAALAAGGEISIAAYNGPRNTVVSGPAALLEPLLARFAAQGIECRRLPVSHAFHSPLMAPMLAAFREVAAGIAYAPPQLPLISNVSGRSAGAELASADYWLRHVLAPVRFADGVCALARQGHRLMIEIGPAATLTGMARHNLDDPAVVLLPSLNRGAAARPTLLAALGEYWANGGAPDWRALGGVLRRELRLPSYPFQHRSHGRAVEADAARASLAGVTALDLPLLARRFSSPLLDETLFETVFSRKALPFIDDHRVFGQLVVAGASHLSLILSAAGQSGDFPSCACVLSEVIFPTALVVPEAGERIVQLSIARQGSGEGHKSPAEFRLVSLADGDREASLHARGRIAAAGAPAPGSDLRASLRAIWQRCAEELPVASVYELQRRRHIVVGPSYQWLSALRRGSGETIARLSAPPELAGRLGRYSLHPGLIDCCFGALAMAQPMDVEESFIPFALAALHFHRCADAQTLLAHAVLRQHDDARLVGDIRLYSEQGEPVADFIGFEARRASRRALLAAHGGGAQIVRLGWQALPPGPATPATGRWLVLSDADGLGERLVAALRAAGASVTAASAAPTAAGLARLGEGHYALPPGSPDAFRELLEVCEPPDAVVYLWGIAALAEDEAGAGFAAYQETACAGALHLLQALIAAGSGARLMLATRGAQAVRSGDRVPAPQQALLWGLGRAAAMEHRQAACVCIDLDPGARSATCVAELIAGAALAAAEDRIAWRDGRAYAARLETVAAPPAAEFAVDAAASYLITGAGGGLGRALADWLAQRGARHLALLSRSPADAAWLDRLTESGARPRCYQADVADRAALAAVLARIEGEQAPLGGIFHLAGELDDGLIAGQRWARWARVLAGKAGGAWHLHQLSLSRALPLFVGYSSAASLLGSAGQSSYAAANAFIDALAQHRRAAGLSGLSVNWGPWAEVGMAARLNAGERARLEALGLGSLAADEALSTLGRLLGAGDEAQSGAQLGAQVGILAIDWQRYRRSHPTPFLSGLATPGEGADEAANEAAQDDSLRQRLQRAAPEQRRALLRSALVALVAQALRLPQNEVAPRERLFDLGVDSLIAVELKNRLQTLLGLSLSTTLLFDYPTIEALCDYLQQQAAPPPAASAAAPVRDAGGDWSEVEAEALLLAQLDRLEGRAP